MSTLYKSTGFNREELSQTCVESSTGQIQNIVNINNSYNLIAQSSVTINGVSQDLDSITFESTANIESLLRKYNLDIIIPIIFLFLGISLGLILNPQNIYISLMGTFILEWIAFLIVPSVISFTTITFISVIILFMLWALYGGRRQ